MGARRGDYAVSARKRAFDLALAVPAGLLLSPLVLACMALVRLTSPGPAIFRQTRIGQGGRAFVCLKLRTMHAGTPDRPSHHTSAAAITPLGAWLRRLKLDELPQLWNVVRGDMSLVGPRPCLPAQTELIEARRRLGLGHLRPGITGVSQVAGLDMSDPKLLAKADATYLSRMSLREDARLLVRTATGVLSRGAIEDAVGRKR